MVSYPWLPPAPAAKLRLRVIEPAAPGLRLVWLVVEPYIALRRLEPPRLLELEKPRWAAPPVGGPFGWAGLRHVVEK